MGDDGGYFCTILSKKRDSLFLSFDYPQPRHCSANKTLPSKNQKNLLCPHWRSKTQMKNKHYFKYSQRSKHSKISLSPQAELLKKQHETLSPSSFLYYNAAVLRYSTQKFLLLPPPI